MQMSSPPVEFWTDSFQVDRRNETDLEFYRYYNYGRLGSNFTFVSPFERRLEAGRRFFDGTGAYPHELDYDRDNYESVVHFVWGQGVGRTCTPIHYIGIDSELSSLDTEHLDYHHTGLSEEEKSKLYKRSWLNIPIACVTKDNLGQITDVVRQWLQKFCFPVGGEHRTNEFYNPTSNSMDATLTNDYDKMYEYLCITLLKYHHRWLSFEDLFRFQNVEFRKRLIMNYGYDKLVADAKMFGGVKRLDKDRRGNELIAITLNDMPEPIVFAHVIDSSTTERYVLRVPPGETKIRDAIAWTFDLDTKEYRPDVQT